MYNMQSHNLYNNGRTRVTIRFMRAHKRRLLLDNRLLYKHKCAENKKEKRQHRQLGRTLIGNRTDSLRARVAAAGDAEDNARAEHNGGEGKKEKRKRGEKKIL